MSQQYRLFLVALQFLTRLPVPPLTHYQSDWLHQSSRYFPAVGLLVGLLVGAAFAFLSMWFSPLLAALVSTALGVYITGAFHEDGLADTCDGLGGGYSKARALEIMKDSRLGTFGVLGLILLVGTKVALLSEFSAWQGLVALTFVHGASRLACISLIVLLPYGGDIDHAKAKPMAQQMNITQWGIAAAWLVLPCVYLMSVFGGTKVLLMCVLMLLTTGFMFKLLKRRLAGYSGDGLGATQQLAEVAGYAGLVALF